MSAAQALLAELRDRGVALRMVGDRLRYRPKAAVTPELRARMTACKPELIALIISAPDAGDGDRPNVERCPACRQPDFVRPLAGGAWRCARCRPYDLPDTEIEWWPRVTMTVPFEASTLTVNESSAACRCCGGTTRWRLRSGGPWVCSRCHPPLPPPEAIETVTIGEAAP